MTPDDNAFDFDELIGTEADFYGVDGTCFKLDEVVYEAIEDEDDGYRSLLGCIEVNADDASSKLFFRMPVARVVIEEINGDVEIDGYHTDFCGYRFVDAHDGHVWLYVGTDESDDYYPYFRFEYCAKAPQSNE